MYVMPFPLLSICIPTYNRADFLQVCLGALARLAESHWRQVEILISDNASTDNTREVVEAFQSRLPIKYFRNSANIGGERNFFAAASRASANHVLVFGDDDELEDLAIVYALENIQLGYDLIVLNYSCWSVDMQRKLRARGLKLRLPIKYRDSDHVLASLGSQLGYISSIVIRKSMYLSVPSSEYEQYVQYGFSHLYATYCGIRGSCKAIYIPEPAFRRREDNCLIFLGPDALQAWTRYFIDGTSLIFEALEQKGYSRRAVIQGKDQVLREFVVPKILMGLQGVDRPKLARRMYRYYSQNWRYWAVCLPGLILPRLLLRAGHTAFVRTRAAGRKILGRMPVRTYEVSLPNPGAAQTATVTAIASFNGGSTTEDRSIEGT